MKMLFVAGLSTVVALMPTAVIIWMMAENNNNGEVYDTLTGRVDVAYVLSVGSVIFVPCFLLSLGVLSLWRRRETL
jgi:hypothetical protein